MKLSKSILKSIIRAIKMTRDEEIGCDECFDKLNEYAELELAGKSPEEALPLVKDHLDKCKDCREEYLALLGALKALKVEQ